jgi:hypothetical protein
MLCNGRRAKRKCRERQGFAVTCCAEYRLSDHSENRS